MNYHEEMLALVINLLDSEVVKELRQDVQDSRDHEDDVLRQTQDKDTSRLDMMDKLLNYLDEDISHR